MRARWMLMSMSVAIALTACSGERGRGGGGGGRTYEPTHDRSNPVTREQETQGKALPLQAMPQGGRAPIGDNVEHSRTTIVAENGKPTFKVDVNSATVADMQRVPGMSENLARAIVNNRPYKDALDLVDRIPYLDPRLVRAYSPYLTYGPARTATQK
jgi:DNA uptake protein ComE-like DNA-binding protein